MTRRLVALGASLAVVSADVLRSLARRFFHRRQPGTAVVLYYHAVDGGDRERFAAQMDTLQRWAVPVPADSNRVPEAGERFAALTFDDGFACVIEHALPELEARRIPMTFFVPTGSWGQRPPWVRNGRSKLSRQTVVTPAQIRRLVDHPLVTVGAHSVSHADLLKVDEAQALREMQESKAELERILGQEVSLFSFPHGRCNARLVELARAVGYRRVFTISPTWAFQAEGEFVTGRVAVEPTDWPLEFWLKVRGAYRWRAAANRSDP